jgi:hypothetical protein
MAAVAMVIAVNRAALERVLEKFLIFKIREPSG